jgi:hypothetical protein
MFFTKLRLQPLPTVAQISIGSLECQTQHVRSPAVVEGVHI